MSVIAAHRCRPVYSPFRQSGLPLRVLLDLFVLAAHRALLVPTKPSANDGNHDWIV